MCLTCPQEERLKEKKLILKLLALFAKWLWCHAESFVQMLEMAKHNKGWKKLMVFHCQWCEAEQ